MPFSSGGIQNTEQGAQPLYAVSEKSSRLHERMSGVCDEGCKMRQ